jgi:hypothetical protein
VRLWSVTIQCWFLDGDKGNSIRREIEVEAETSDGAKHAALEYCDGTAHSSKEWTRFEFIKSHSMDYPEYPREVKP